METHNAMDSAPNAKKRRAEDASQKEEDTSTNSFYSLKPKVLMHIFLMVNHIKDLSSLGSSCKKFNKIAREVFAKIHCDEFVEVRATDSLMKTAQILRCFQNQITKLILLYGEKSKANIKVDVLVGKYCRQVLAEVHFSEVGLYSSARTFISPFRKVTNLVIRSGMFSGKLDDIKTWFPNIMTLDIHRGVEPGGTKDNTLIPSLRHLSFSYDPDSDLDMFTNLLVESNPQLVGLKVCYTNETPTEHLWMIRNSLPNLLRLTLDVKMLRVDKDPFKPLLFKNLRYLNVICANSQILKQLVIASTHRFKRLELSIDGNIDANCINFLKRHQSEEIHLAVSKMNNQQIEQLNKVLSTTEKVELVIHNEFSVTRGGLMNLISKCENLKRIRIDQPNMCGLPTIEIIMDGINESIWNKE